MTVRGSLVPLLLEVFDRSYPPSFAVGGVVPSVFVAICPRGLAFVGFFPPEKGGAAQLDADEACIFPDTPSLAAYFFSWRIFSVRKVLTFFPGSNVFSRLSRTLLLF